MGHYCFNDLVNQFYIVTGLLRITTVEHDMGILNVIWKVYRVEGVAISWMGAWTYGQMGKVTERNSN